MTEVEGKWTKGPWYFGNTASHERIILGGAEPSRYVCHVTVEQIGGGAIARGMEAEREANATLIAAAPDLLEALMTTLSLLEIWRGWTPSYSTAHTDFESLPEVIKARSAISLATGGEDA